MRTLKITSYFGGWSSESADQISQLSITPERQGYPLPYESIEFILSPGEKRPVEAAGESWMDDLKRRHVKVAV